MVRAWIPDVRRWSTRRLYFTSLAVYAVSFALPSVINPHPTPYSGWVDTWGWQAALISVATPMVIFMGPSNLGYASAAVLIALGSSRAAIVGSVAALVSMAYCGIIVPTQPSGGPLRFPSGHLGPGYYLWFAAGVMMFACSVRARRETLNEAIPGLGLTHPPPPGE